MRSIEPIRYADRLAPRIVVLSIGLLLGLAGGLRAQAEREQATTASETGSARYASPHGPLRTELDCSSCHDSDGWRVDRPAFDHAKGGFPLEGRHQTVRCAACHLDLRFDEPNIAVTDCASCHSDVHQGSLGVECASCHDTDSFEARSDPNVHARTSFPLTGSHLVVHCESCHLDDRRPRFDALDTDCYSCHSTDYENSITVNHATQGYSTDCLECHNTVAWFDRVRIPPSLDGRGR